MTGVFNALEGVIQRAAGQSPIEKKLLVACAILAAVALLIRMFGYCVRAATGLVRQLRQLREEVRSLSKRKPKKQAKRRAKPDGKPSKRSTDIAAPR